MREYAIACVVGARPNFMKMAPILRELDATSSNKSTLIHTGQHYDASLSDVFFQELEMRKPDVSLEVGSGKHGAQTARILERIESVLEVGDRNGRPFDRCLVVGDVNSTMAAAIAASKLNIPVAHVEAGLRSFDRSMPEEINRIVTDAISDLLFVSEPSGVANLLREGHPRERVHLVGNVMIDTLLRLLPEAKNRPILKQLQLLPGGYGVVTLHRPANVDTPASLEALASVLIRTSRMIPLVFAVHPRTRGRLEEFGILPVLSATESIRLTPPLGYLDFLSLTSQAAVVVTDSGGLQEETTALKIPCLTMRPNTERPVTTEEGSSTLIGSDFALLERLLRQVIEGKYKLSRCPPLWDGMAAKRIAEILLGC